MLQQQRAQELAEMGGIVKSWSIALLDDAVRGARPRRGTTLPSNPLPRPAAQFRPLAARALARL